MSMCRINLPKTKVQWAIKELYESYKNYRTLFWITLGLLIVITILLCSVSVKRTDEHFKSQECIFYAHNAMQAEFQANCR